MRARTPVSSPSGRSAYGALTSAIGSHARERVRERLDAGGAQLLELAPPVEQDLRELRALVRHLR